MRNKLLAAGAASGVLGVFGVVALPLLLVSALSSSASTPCTGFPLPAPTGANVTDVWANLLAQGFSETAAAGVMGNMQTETAGTFDPTIVQGGGHSLNPADAGGGGYGLVQWTPGAKLIPLLHGAVPSIPSEVAALTEQLRTTEAAAGAALQQATTPEQAADVFGLQYERYAGPPQPVRASQARAIYDQYAGRAPTGDPVEPVGAAGGCPAPTGGGPFTGPGGVDPQACSVLPDPSSGRGCLTPRMLNLYTQLVAQGWTGIACWDPHLQNPNSDHPLGRACDVTLGAIGRLPTDEEKARGDALCVQLQASAVALGINYIIWYGHIWSTSRASEGWRLYNGGGVYNPGDITGGHFDHVHISVF